MSPHQPRSAALTFTPLELRQLIAVLEMALQIGGITNAQRRRLERILARLYTCQRALRTPGSP